MQGETWLGEPRSDTLQSGWAQTAAATEQQRHELTTGFDAVAAHARAVERPIFVGEFASSSNADMSSRVRWAKFNRELAKQHGSSRGYWSFGPSFAIYDIERNRWRPEFLSALIP
jgi:endoglucanase